MAFINPLTRTLPLPKPPSLPTNPFTNPLVTEQAEVVGEPPLSKVTAAPTGAIPPPSDLTTKQQIEGVAAAPPAPTMTPGQIQARNFMTQKYGRDLTAAELNWITSATDEQLRTLIQREAPPPQIEEVSSAPTDVAMFTPMTQDALQRGDPDFVLNQMFRNYQDFFAGFDWNSIGKQSQDYLQQLLTGQTAATRALQAREATAMAQGVKNLMNNIGATAANAGITGQALSNFYNAGLNQIGDMMGKFAMDNIIRMADTQAQGFDGLMRMFKLSDEQARSWMSAYKDWQDFTIGNDQWNKSFGWNALKYITEAAATDPTAGELLGRLYAGLEQGKTISEILSQTDMDYLSNTVRDAQSLTDVAAEVKYIQDELGYQALVTQATDINGNPIFKSNGDPVWEVSIATEMVDGNLRMIPYTAAGGGEDGGGGLLTPTPAPPGTPSVNTPEEIMAALTDMGTAEWNRMTPEQQTNVNNFLLTSFDSLDNAQLRILAYGTPEDAKAEIIEQYGDSMPTLQGDINNPQDSRIWVSTPDGMPGYITGSYIGVGPSYGSPGRHYHVRNMNNEVIGYLYTPDFKSGTVRYWRKNAQGADWEGEFQMPAI